MYSTPNEAITDFKSDDGENNSGGGGGDDNGADEDDNNSNNNEDDGDDDTDCDHGPHPHAVALNDHRTTSDNTYCPEQQTDIWTRCSSRCWCWSCWWKKRMRHATLPFKPTQMKQHTEESNGSPFDVHDTFNHRVDSNSRQRPRSAGFQLGVDENILCDPLLNPRRCRSSDWINHKSDVHLLKALDSTKQDTQRTKLPRIYSEIFLKGSGFCSNSSHPEPMESGMKTNDSTTCLSHNSKATNFSQWSASPPGLMDLSWMADKINLIDTIQLDVETMSVSCQLCGLSIKSNKMLPHMAVHFLQLSQKFGSDDLPVINGKQQRFRSSLELLNGNAIRPDQLFGLRDTAKAVLNSHLGPHINKVDVDTFLALALELVAHSPAIYQQTYDHVQKDWFHLDRLHYQQLTTQSTCSSCKPMLHFALETTHTLHNRLTHPVSDGLSNSQIVEILDELLDKAKSCSQSGRLADFSPHAETFSLVNSSDWNPSARSMTNPMKVKANQNSLGSEPLKVLSLQKFDCPKPSPPLIDGVDELPAAAETLSDFVIFDPSLSANGFNNTLTALSSLPQSLIPFKAGKLPLSLSSLKKSKALPDFFNPSLFSGLMLAQQSHHLESNNIGTSEPTVNLNNDKTDNGINTPVVPQRRSRTRLSEAQLAVLRSYFDINNSPCEEKMAEICTKTGLPGKVVKHWFRNTLFKERQRTKDNPYNFSVPPSTSIDLEEYEKTGRIEFRSAPAHSLLTTLSEDLTTPIGSTKHLITKGEKTSPESEAMQMKESQILGVSQSSQRGIHSDEQAESDRTVIRKRNHENRSPYRSPTQITGPKRSRCSSAGSFGVEYDSLKPSSQVSSPTSASNPPSVPVDSQITPNSSNSILNSSESNEQPVNSFDLAQWLVQNSIGEFPSALVDSRQNEEKCIPTLSSGLNHYSLTSNNCTSIGFPITANSPNGNNNINYFVDHTTPYLGPFSSFSYNQPAIETFQFQKQMEAFMIAAALSQKVSNSSPPPQPLRPPPPPPLLDAYSSPADASSDAPLDLSTSSSCTARVTSPSVPLFSVDLPLNSLDPHLVTFNLNTSHESGPKSYPSMIHTLPNNSITNGTSTISHSTISSSTPGVRRNRTSITALQSRCMQAIYAHHKTPSVHECDRLGATIGLTRRVVQVWFQNQRAKEKKMARVASSCSPINTSGPSYPSTTNSGLLDFALNPSYCGLCDVNIRCDLTGSVPVFARTSTTCAGGLDLASNSGMGIHSHSVHSPNGPMSTSANALASHASFVDHLFSPSHLKKLIGVCSVELQTRQV
ncbi:Zinc finger homeobox protein 3 [Fasciola hepatica]|uniref:Zinc finger homeobox protein 3 n=1 Tax=Fasciola hepatica TaxID=6192 RepID=A0A4E0RX51_FASHE|nr:Zinc finger homeobox protein 3 [Fasciola hepatica]